MHARKTTSCSDQPEASGGVARRRCLLTGEVKPKASLLRFVIGPDGNLVPDMAERLPGRGLWLSASRNIVKTAGAKRAFAKAARTPVAVPDDLDGQIEGLLVRRLVEGLGLARRARDAVAGFEKVRELLRRGPARVVFAAADGSGSGFGQVRALIREQPGEAPILIDCLSAAELGMAFDRERTVHVAVRPCALAERLIRDAGRLQGFRGTDAKASTR